MAFDRRGALCRGLDVRPSGVAGAGDGLFVTRPFAQGELICEYVGRVLSLARVMQMDVRARDYVMGGFGLNVHVDGRSDLNMLARYINDNGDASMINAEFVKLRAERKALVRALRPLRSGEEVFCAYGDGYWRARQREPTACAPTASRGVRCALRAAMLVAPLLVARALSAC
ncbi:hypothetical protein KFE25_010953 [Diacronema lutheri]|uniref:SET domain-containing protein n=2 Tax=Diacronema lutheri TaxID=2081491 RepID=A0A8J5XFQ4_DIALT|nr:hypothetical protein KFE25_010953 [Diacronema lutheri]